MKRIISAALLLIHCLFMVPVAAAAQTDVVVTLSSGLASAGESIKVDLTLTASVPVNSIAVSEISYDTDVLTFTGFSDYEHLDSLTALPPTFDKDKGAVVIGLRQAQVFDGKLCSLNFEVREDATAGVVSIDAIALTKNSAAIVSSAVIPAAITVSASVPAACTIAVGDVEHGNVSVDKSAAAVGETVTVTAIPAEGYVLKSICVDGTAITGNTFIATTDHVVTAVFELGWNLFTRRSLAVWLAQRVFDPEMQPAGENAFVDIAPTDADYREIMLCTEHGLFAGSEGKFMPDGRVTRAQLAAILVKLHLGSEINADSFKGMNWFADVSYFEGGWAEGYITLAVALGTMSGYSDGTFRPGNFAAQEDIIESALYRKVLGYGGCGSSLLWVVYDDGELVISGIGAMNAYSTEKSTPWAEHRISVRKITIGNGVTAVGNVLYTSCYNVRTVVLGDSINVNSGAAFVRTTMLENIEVDSNNPYIMALDGVLYSKDGKVLITHPMHNPRTTFTVPDGVETIGELAFGNSAGSGNYFLTSITLPDSVTTIGAWAFANCAKLETLNLGNGLISIGSGAGFFTKALKSVVFPASLESCSKVFWGECGIERLEFLGNAPSVENGEVAIPNGNKNVTIYYHEGTNGWTEGDFYDAENDTWCGCPLVMIPKTQEQSGLRGRFSLKVVNTITVNGEEVDICRWVWTPCEG